MSWNHRILAHKDGEDWFFQIHEVFYDNDIYNSETPENDKPNGYTEKGVSVGAESIVGIHWVLDKMRESADKPILSAENFPNEWVEDNK